jgi:PEP-CTERM motif
MNRCAFAVRATILLFAALTLAAGGPALAAPITIDFEHLPLLAVQPNNFAAAGPMQVYNDPGVFNISGGVALGNPTFLASFAAHGSPPNLYGTTDIADPSLLSTITLTLPNAEDIISVIGVLFNGQNSTESYEVDAFSGVTMVDHKTFTNMAADTDASGFGNFSLTSNAANPITSVTITTPNSGVNGWDFLVDTIQISAAVANIPEPSTALILLSGILGLVAARRRR